MNRDLEEKLKSNASYDPEYLIHADIDFILQNVELEPLGKGTFSRVFRLKDTKWVVKEGRWDKDINVFDQFSMKIPLEYAEPFFNVFELTFMPYFSEIKSQYKYYLQFADYFGYFDSEDKYFHPKRHEILQKQKNIRNSISNRIQELEKFYNFHIDKDIHEVLRSEYLYANLLPKEYLILGSPISPENDGKETYYLFQEFVEGDLLHDITLSDLKKKPLYEIIIMLLLILLMKKDIKLMPDMRPRRPDEFHNWLTKTDNVVLRSDNSVKFIDTRWFAKTDSNFLKRWLVVPDIMTNATKYYLNILIKKVAQLDK